MQSEKAKSTRLRDADLRLKDAQIQLNLAETDVRESEKVLNEQKTLIINLQIQENNLLVFLFL